MDIFVAIVSACIAIASMMYCIYLHIYYRNRALISERQVQEYKYRENMRALGLEEDDIDEELKKIYALSDLVDTNKKLKKVVKKHKLS